MDQRIFIIFLFYQAIKIQCHDNIMYLFGTEHNDHVMLKADDSFEGPLKIGENFTFNGNRFSKLFIGTNGVLSFGSGVRSYMPLSFPTLKNFIIAPFWTDIDITKGGEIYHREITDQTTLDQISHEISGSFARFVAIWAYLVTWHEVAPFLSDNSTHRNTFQVLITTNGFNSYAILNYKKLEWSLSKNIPVHAQAGINAGDGIKFDSISGSLTQNVIDLTQKSNVDILGKWIFKVDEGELIETECDYRSYMSLNPYSVYFFGGEDVTVSGPCFDLDHDSAKIFLDSIEVECKIISSFSCQFKTPFMKKIGYIHVYLIDNSTNYYGYLYTKESSYNKIEEIKEVYNASVNEEIRLESIDSDSVFDLYLIRINNNGSEISLARPGVSKASCVNSSDIFNQTSMVDIEEAYFALAPSQTSRFILNPSLIFLLVMPIYIIIELITAEFNCKLWHRSQPNPQFFIDILPPCPPMIPSNSSSNFFTLYYMDNLCNTWNRAKCNMFHPKAQTCYRSFETWFSTGTVYQKCCYDSQGSLLVGPPGGGTLIYNSYNSLNSELAIYAPYLRCCVLSDNCDLYYEKRPSDDSTRWVNDGVAFVMGDPHFLTFDELAYTFNGYGEYTLFQIKDINFTVQVRIAPITSKNGTISQGTVYKAISVKGNNNTDHVQVELDFKNNLFIRINGEFFYVENESLSFNGLQLTVTDQTKIELVYNVGINIEILVTSSRNALMLFTSISQNYRSRTVGLLGNFNGDSSDDFILPNGTLLNLNAKNDRDIFENFGQKWMISENESIFYYELGFGYHSHLDAAFIPKFIQDGIVFNDSNLETVAREKCGNNSDCLFDISITGDSEIGILNLDLSNVAESYKQMKNFRNMSNFENTTASWLVVGSTENPGETIFSLDNGFTQNSNSNSSNIQIIARTNAANKTIHFERSKDSTLSQTNFQTSTDLNSELKVSLGTVDEDFSIKNDADSSTDAIMNGVSSSKVNDLKISTQSTVNFKISSKKINKITFSEIFMTTLTTEKKNEEFFSGNSGDSCEYSKIMLFFILDLYLVLK
ncbi:sushi domain-containing 2-like [Brachionus plicatilis]|uniref:Sushi domain-containing 2-like n=1 Tax=Brachionus plicatilis TaxID=10195 RepID=A0A3M7RSV1_BRAPC|nr:sushi domain-containing 2-like [Brachionus plicatilis]